MYFSDWVVFFFIVVPITIMWVFALIDLFRQEMSGWTKAIWLLVILVFPIVGTIVYLVAAPRRTSVTEAGAFRVDGAGSASRYEVEMAKRYAAKRNEEIAKLDALHTSGGLTDAEYEREKEHVISRYTIG
jgi:hypothetical protein